jgi:LysM repeat protein
MAYGVTKKEIMLVNHLVSEDLYEGQNLKLPLAKEAREEFRQKNN